MIEKGNSGKQRVEERSRVYVCGFCLTLIRTLEETDRQTGHAGDQIEWLKECALRDIEK